jgi:hypothetical protein
VRPREGAMGSRATKAPLPVMFLNWQNYLAVISVFIQFHFLLQFRSAYATERRKTKQKKIIVRRKKGIRHCQ